MEAPSALRGTFDEAYLSLPKAVLISVMKKHLRYFPLRSAQNGHLLPYFITVRNGNREYSDVVIDGNELVIRARFSDAAFFISEDLKHPLEAYLPKLDTLIFQTKLGSMLAKSKRIEALAEMLAPELAVTPEQIQLARRAAQLCKADLVTHMVVEMTALQGIIGRFYALKSGEAEAVADASLRIQTRFRRDETPRPFGFLWVVRPYRLWVDCCGEWAHRYKRPVAQAAWRGGWCKTYGWEQTFDLKSSLSGCRNCPSS